MFNTEKIHGGREKVARIEKIADRIEGDITQRVHSNLGKHSTHNLHGKKIIRF